MKPAHAPANRVLVPFLDRPPAHPAALKVRRLSGRTMGTSWSAKFAAKAEAEPAALAAIGQVLDVVEGQMSPWRPDSDLCRFNRSPAGSWTPLPTALAEVVRAALTIAECTGGAFDPTVGALTDLWGFGAAPFDGAPPEDRAIRAAAADWRALRIEGGRLFQPGGVALDLCGIAKGYAVDQASRALEALGVASHLIEIGGELRGAGVRADGQPWWVELEAPPASADIPRTVLALHGLSVATSGDYRRFFDYGGRRFSHTLDPRDGFPVDGGVASVSVIRVDCMMADGLATALTVMGLDGAMALCRREGIAARIFVRTAEDQIEEHLSPALRGMLVA